MTQTAFVESIATWAGTLTGVAYAAVYQSARDWQTGDGEGYGGLSFDVPAVFVHAFGVKPTTFGNITDFDMEITLVLFTSGETRRSDARDLTETIYAGLYNQRYGNDANLVQEPRLTGTITDQTPEWAEGEGLAIFTMTYYQVARSQTAPGIPFNTRF